MLNELNLLSRSLASRKIETKSWHASVKPFRKGSAIVVALDSGSRVARVSSIPAEQVAELRRIAPQNEKSFPGFNLKKPIIKGDLAWATEPEGFWREASESFASLPLAYEEADCKRLDSNIRFAVEELATRLSSDDPRLAATLELTRRLKHFQGKIDSMVRQISAAALASVKAGELSREAALEFLIGKFKSSSQKFEALVTLILDVSDTHQFGCRVADFESAEAWSDQLFRTDTAGSKDLITCALSGRQDAAIRKFSEPNLPGLGPTYLMSMNQAAACQTRYGKTSTAIFPIGKSEEQRLFDSLQFITDPKRSGKTHAQVPNPFRDGNDLLIAYREDEPEAELAAVDLFADITSSPAETALFEERTKSIVKSLQARKTSTHDPAIQVFAISAIDKARKQVVFNGRYELRQIQDGCDAWFSGASNIPRVSIPFPLGREKRLKILIPGVPAPVEVLRSFKRQWIRSGTASVSVPGVDLASIYQLLLEPDRGRQVSSLLRRYLQLSSPLLTGLGRSRANLGAISEAARKELLVALPILGILLSKLGHMKEVYMQSREFLVGQFLQFADRLHKFYCEKERKGAIPPQLAGNAALSAALQSPHRAFATVGQRIRPYLAWADKYNNEDAGLAKWMKKQLGTICAQLKESDLNARVDDIGRAQLFLGYLADINFKQEHSS